jgi:hypothetical protein
VRDNDLRPSSSKQRNLSKTVETITFVNNTLYTVQVPTNAIVQHRYSFSNPYVRAVTDPADRITRVGGIRLWGETVLRSSSRLPGLFTDGSVKSSVKQWCTPPDISPTARRCCCERRNKNRTRFCFAHSFLISQHRPHIRNTRHALQLNTLLVGRPVCVNTRSPRTAVRRRRNSHRTTNPDGRRVHLEIRFNQSTPPPPRIDRNGYHTHKQNVHW